MRATASLVVAAGGVQPRRRGPPALPRLEDELFGALLLPDVHRHLRLQPYVKQLQGGGGGGSGGREGEWQAALRAGVLRVIQTRGRAQGERRSGGGAGRAAPLLFRCHPCSNSVTRSTGSVRPGGGRALPASQAPRPGREALACTRGTFSRKAPLPSGKIMAGSSSLYCSVGSRMYASRDSGPPWSCDGTGSRAGMTQRRLRCQLCFRGCGSSWPAQPAHSCELQRQECVYSSRL